MLGESVTAVVWATVPSTIRLTVPGFDGYCSSFSGCVPAATVAVIVQAEPVVQVAEPPFVAFVPFMNREAMDGRASLQL